MATTTTATTANTVKTAYDRTIFKALRPHLHFDGVADVKPTLQTQPGATVGFVIDTDLAVASTSIDESVDVDPATLASTTASVTIAEYGNVATVTEKLLGVSFDIPPFEVPSFIGDFGQHAERLGVIENLHHGKVAPQEVRHVTKGRIAGVLRLAKRAPPPADQIGSEPSLPFAEPPFVADEDRARVETQPKVRRLAALARPG